MERTGGIPRGDGDKVVFAGTRKTSHVWSPLAVSPAPHRQPRESLGAILDRAISAVAEW
jgi:hypothetical protein